MVFATDPTRTVNLEQNETPVSKALSAVGAAELAIARAMAATATAIAEGEVKPCGCLYTLMACAQEDLEKVKVRLKGHSEKPGMSNSNMAEVIMGLMRD